MWRLEVTSHTVTRSIFVRNRAWNEWLASRIKVTGITTSPFFAHRTDADAMDSIESAYSTGCSASTPLDCFFLWTAFVRLCRVKARPFLQPSHFYPNGLNNMGD